MRRMWEMATETKSYTLRRGDTKGDDVLKVLKALTPDGESNPSEYTRGEP